MPSISCDEKLLDGATGGGEVAGIGRFVAPGTLPNMLSMSCDEMPLPPEDGAGGAAAAPPPTRPEAQRCPAWARSLVGSIANTRSNACNCSWGVGATAPNHSQASLL